MVLGFLEIGGTRTCLYADTDDLVEVGDICSSLDLEGWDGKHKLGVGKRHLQSQEGKQRM